MGYPHVSEQLRFVEAVYSSVKKMAGSAHTMLAAELCTS